MMSTMASTGPHRASHLAGRTAIVTGSASGLGLAIAGRLAADGANLVVHGLDAGLATSAAEQIAATAGAGVLTSTADLRDPLAIEALVAEAAERFGGVDIVVGNAVVRRTAPIEAWTAGEWDDSLAVNLSSVFHLARLTIPGMRERGWGRFLTMSSIYGARGEVDRVGYVTTKTALLGLTRAIAVETAGTGITANALSPGTVATPPIVEKLEAAAAERGMTMDAIAREYLAARHPTGEFVPVEDVAELAAFLCGPFSTAITGATFPVDGGWGAR